MRRMQQLEQLVATLNHAKQIYLLAAAKGTVACQAVWWQAWNAHVEASKFSALQCDRKR